MGGQGQGRRERLEGSQGVEARAGGARPAPVQGSVQALQHAGPWPPAPGPRRVLPARQGALLDPALERGLHGHAGAAGRAGGWRCQGWGACWGCWTRPEQPAPASPAASFQPTPRTSSPRCSCCPRDRRPPVPQRQVKVDFGHLHEGHLGRSSEGWHPTGSMRDGERRQDYMARRPIAGPRHPWQRPATAHLHSAHHRHALEQRAQREPQAAAQHRVLHAHLRLVKVGG